MSEGDGISNRPGPASAAEPSMEEILASIRRILSDEEGAAKMPPEEDELLLDASMRVPVQDFRASATQPPEPEPAREEQEQVPPVHFAPDTTFELPPSPETLAEPAMFEPEPAPEPMPAPEPETLAPEALGTFEPSPPAEEPPAQMFEPISEPAPVLNHWMDDTLPQAPVFQPEPETEKEEYKMEEQVQGPDGLVGDEAVSEISNSIGALVRSVSAERSSSVGRPGITIEDIVREEVKPVLKAWLDTHLPTLVERVVRAEINRVMDRAQG